MTESSAVERLILDELIRSGLTDDAGWSIIDVTILARKLATLSPDRIRAEAFEEAAKVAETLPIGGGTLSSWINTNESPMGATRRHIATAIRSLKDPK